MAQRVAEKSNGQMRIENASATTAIVMLLIGGSMGMSWMMAYERLPQAITHTLISLSDNPVGILLLINLILLVVGTFMDTAPAVIIFLPIVTALGVDPVHFGIVMVLNLCVGLCTPPAGSILFIGASVAGTSIDTIARPLLPLFLAMIAALRLVTYLPAISLWLPEAVPVLRKVRPGTRGGVEGSFHTPDPQLQPTIPESRRWRTTRCSPAPWRAPSPPVC